MLSLSCSPPRVRGDRALDRESRGLDESPGGVATPHPLTVPPWSIPETLLTPNKEIRSPKHLESKISCCQQAHSKTSNEFQVEAGHMDIQNPDPAG